MGAGSSTAFDKGDELGDLLKQLFTMALPLSLFSFRSFFFSFLLDHKKQFSKMFVF